MYSAGFFLSSQLNNYLGSLLENAKLSSLRRHTLQWVCEHIRFVWEHDT